MKKYIIIAIFAILCTNAYSSRRSNKFNAAFGFADTTAMKAYKTGSEPGDICYLEKLSLTASEETGGYFILLDSTYKENGVIAYDCTTPGLQWVRQQYLEEGKTYAEWAGAVGNGTADDGAEINKCLALDGWVQLKSKVYATSIPLVVDESNRLSGTSPSYPAKAFSTTIYLLDGSDDNVIESDTYDAGTGWMHGLIIEDLRIDGNKANNSSGNGIALIRMGETSTIRNVMVWGTAGVGIYLIGNSAPAYLYDVSMFQNAGNGLYINNSTMVDESSISVGLFGVSGDDNDESFIKTIGPISITIMSPKLEASAADYHDPAMLFDSLAYNSSVNIIGGNLAGAAADHGHIAVRWSHQVDLTAPGTPTETNLPYVNVQGLCVTNYDTLFIAAAIDTVLRSAFSGSYHVRSYLQAPYITENVTERMMTTPMTLGHLGTAPVDVLKFDGTRDYHWQLYDNTGADRDLKFYGGDGDTTDYMFFYRDGGIYFGGTAGITGSKYVFHGRTKADTLSIPTAAPSVPKAGDIRYYGNGTSPDTLAVHDGTRWMTVPLEF